MKIAEKYKLQTDKLDFQNPDDRGLECEVFNTPDDDIVFKLYKTRADCNAFSREVVEQIVAFNKKYAENGLAPQVCSGVIQVDNRYGYFVERVVPINKIPLIEISKNLIAKLAEALGFDDVPSELYSNWGITKDGRPVLFDFGPITLSYLGLYEGELV